MGSSLTKAKANRMAGTLAVLDPVDNLQNQYSLIFPTNIFSTFLFLNVVLYIDYLRCWLFICSRLFLTHWVGCFRS